MMSLNLQQLPYYHSTSSLTEKKPPPTPNSMVSSPGLGSTNIHIRPPNSASPFASSSVNVSSSNVTYFSQPPSGSRSTTSLDSKPLTPANFNSNREVDPNKSLFIICAKLKQRFESIPSLQPFLEACYSQTFDRSASSATLNNSHLNHGLVAHDKLDAVTIVWRFFRLGSSLCALFNLLEPNALLKDSFPDDVKASKRAVYDFVQGCKAELGYSDDQLFTISNVFSDNTHDLLKVIRTVEILLENLDAKNLLPPFNPQPVEFVPNGKRGMVVKEFLETERKFVEDLEILVRFQNELQKTSILSVDTIHALFPNLMALVDFQRRFLIGVEFNATLPPEEQRFGALFESLEDGFEVYKGYSLNQPHACEIATAEAPKLQALSHIVEPTYELQCILIKPVQRICKYPLLFKELIKETPEDWPYYQELYEGLECSERITSNVNESQRQVENVNSLKELQERLRDWRGHNLADFGELLHEGVFPVVKTGFEREYHLYLFENIILCCKEANQSKKSNPLSKKSKDKALANQSKRSSLVLKGRIYMAYITNVTVSKRETGYFMHISWGQDDALDTGFFDIRFRNEELLNQWESTIRRMVARYQENINSTQIHHHHHPSTNGATASYESDDDYDESTTTSATPSLNSFKPLPNEPDPPTSVATSSTAPATRTISASSNGSSSTTTTTGYFPYSSMNSLPEEFGAFSVTTKVTTKSVSSASTSAPPSRNRSASTPSLTNSYNTTPPTSSNGRVKSPDSYVPPMPPLPSNVPTTSSPSYGTPKAARIKSESAAVDRSRQPPQHSHINIVTGQREQSFGSYDSSASTSSSMSTTARSATSSSTATTPVMTHSTGMAGNLKVKLHYIEDSFLIIVPSTIKYSQLLERIERKIRLCGKQTPNPLRIKYKDEDDDFVTINSDEDIHMALEISMDNNSNDLKNSNALTLWVA